MRISIGYRKTYGMFMRISGVDYRKAIKFIS